MASPRTRLALTLAFGAALLSSGMWIWLVWAGPLAGGGMAGPPSWLAAILFPSLAWAGAFAAVRDAPLVVGLVGLISLVPVGLFFLAAPGVLRLIGVPPLLLLAAAVLLVREMRSGDP